MNQSIQIRGARTNNLKNIDVDIPRDQLVCITGRSGSGKSSLAFGTLFAEGQRQYVESLSIYSRQFFNQMGRAKVDSIEGLQPTLSLDQHVGTSNRRSTIGTITEIHDYLRVLMARAGEIHCYECGRTIQQQTTYEVRDSILNFPPDTKLMVLAPVVVGRKGAHKDVVESIRKERLVRVRIDGEVHDIERIPPLDPNVEHSIDAITDRIIVREGVEQRLTESIELAVKLSGGTVTVSYLLKNPSEGEPTDWQEKLFSTHYACPDCDINYSEVEPRTFSFNSPHGACPECEGIGGFVQFDMERVVPDRSLPLSDGAVKAWSALTTAQQKKQIRQLVPLLNELGANGETVLDSLSREQLDRLFHSDNKKTPGIVVLLEKELATTIDDDRVEMLENFLSEVECRECRGSRLRKEANSVFWHSKSIGDLSKMSLAELQEFFKEVEDDPVSLPVTTAIRHRLKFLNEVGVGYLTLGRAGPTLSGGELQRVRLASSIGSGLTNVCYVLDEPTIGLHPRDNDRLIDSIKALQQSGNSVVIVEHDEAMIQASDHVIDIGPGAGKSGGEVVYAGNGDALVDCQESLTAAFLSDAETMSVRSNRRQVDDSRMIRLTGATGYNLKNVDLEIPIGLFTCVSGVSGSGKSTLINRSLAPAIGAELGYVVSRPEPFESISGIENIESLVRVDQKPIGKSARGCPATYLGVFDEFRKLFAATKIAKERGYSSTRFSFNSKDGRCPDCLGHGIKRIKMNFLSDMFVECVTCHGKRFNEQTLQVRFRNRSIAELLAMSVEQACVEFENFSKIYRMLKTVCDVGLGYLPLGQPATTLSGGESQRLKLARELAKPNSGKSLYILDEPTTGLHFADVRALLIVLHQLVDLGNTVVVIEHNLDVVRSADWIVDLGPEGGEQGGEIVAVGTPEDVAKNVRSLTGKFLAI